MRTIVAWLAWASLLAVACTRPNPDACCTSEAECQSFGITGGIRNCSDGKVCDMNGACVAPQCTTSADCTDPTAPICQDSFCVAKCATNDDCDGVAGRPFCEPDGTCGECTTDADCTGSDSSVCDGSSHACRGCVADTECPSGVCVEATGICPGSDAIIVLEQGGSDSGSCTTAAPCGSVSFALGKVTAQRSVIDILGGSFGVGSGGVSLDGVDLVFHGDQTVLFSTGSAAMFVVEGGANVLFERLVFPQTPTSVSVPVGGAVTVSDGSAGSLDLEGGQLVLENIADLGIENGFVLSCNNGSITIEHSHAGPIDTSGCSFTRVAQTLITLENGQIGIAHGVIQLENDVITSNAVATDAVSIASGATGSYFRFNTLANTSGEVGNAHSLECDASIDVTSNVFAWGTSVAPTCSTRYSLFDSNVTQTGSGNQSLDSSTFFVSPDTGDFHLAANSPAKGAGDPSQTSVTTDFDGNPRPNPAGSPPDIGAFEAP